MHIETSYSVTKAGTTSIHLNNYSTFIISIQKEGPYYNVEDRHFSRVKSARVVSFVRDTLTFVKFYG